MGAGMSAFSGTPTEVKTLLNVIMKEMFSRADLVDLYSLADPRQCSKYIVVASKALEKLFMSINLEPRKGPGGKILFQKIDTIKRANPMGEEHVNTCRMLSFFFIRIFRIYAALTLSILDSELPSSDPVTHIKDIPGRRGLLAVNPAQLRGFKQPNIPQRKSWFGRGGELVQGAFPVAPGQPGGSGNYYLDPVRAGDYALLNKYLLTPSTNPIGSRGDLRFQDFDITIPQDTLYDNDPAVVPPLVGRITKDFTAIPQDRRAKPSLFYSFKDGDIFSNLAAELIITRDRDGNLDITLQNTRFTTGNKNGNRKTVTGKLLNRRPGDETPQSKSGKFLPGLIQELFVRAADLIDPPKFSVVDFFKKFDIISSLEGRVGIKQTSITIDNPGDLRVRTRIPILYKGKYQIGKGKEREKNVEIEVEIFGNKRDKIVGRPQEYSITFDLETMETKPPEVLQMLERNKEASSTFFTGENDTNTPLDIKGRSIPQFLQYVIERLLSKISDENSIDDIKYDKEGRPKPYDSAEIPEEYKIKKMWDALAKNPPVKAHCVARAVQLLNIAAIHDPRTGEAYSKVCDVKFPYIGNGSLPEPGKSVLTSDAINSLAMLFVDQLAGDNFIPKVTNTPKFKEFREKLKTSFHRFETVEQMRGSLRDETNLNFNKIKEIQMPFCDGHQDTKLKLKGVVIDYLRRKVQELMLQQKTHIARVMQLMFKLFNEKAVRKGIVEINDNILSSGMEGLNILAEEARELLIDYYSNCEKTYKDGLFEIYNRGGTERGSVTFEPR